MWTNRVATVRAKGMQAIVDAVMPRFLSGEFIAAQPARAQTVRDAFLATPPLGYAGAGAAIRDMAVMERLADIRAPTLVVIGSRDVSTPLAGNGEHLIARIPGAQTTTIDAPHIAPVEAPEETAQALVAAFA
jgi:pimeloyl-ACP methyl ester carboxylesterase